MKWLEVIKLRSAGGILGLLEELLLPISGSNQRGLVEMKSYRHGVLETDLSVHPHWDSEMAEPNGSALGLRLAQALKEFGLIDHSVWIEEKKSSSIDILIYPFFKDRIILLQRVIRGGKEVLCTAEIAASRWTKRRSPVPIAGFLR